MGIDVDDPINKHVFEYPIGGSHFTYRGLFNVERHELEHARQDDDFFRFQAGDLTLSNSRKFHAVIIRIFKEVLYSRFPHYMDNFNEVAAKLYCQTPGEYEAFAVSGDKVNHQNEKFYSPIGNFWDAYARATKSTSKDLSIKPVTAKLIP